MSRDNIVKVRPAGLESIRVTFHCKNGELMTYEYSGLAAAQFIAGADPRYLSGERVEDDGGSMGIMSAVELAETLAEVGAMVGL